MFFDSGHLRGKRGFGILLLHAPKRQQTPMGVAPTQEDENLPALEPAPKNPRVDLQMIFEANVSITVDTLAANRDVAKYQPARGRSTSRALDLPPPVTQISDEPCCNKCVDLQRAARSVSHTIYDLTEYLVRGWFSISHMLGRNRMKHFLPYSI